MKKSSWFGFFKTVTVEYFADICNIFALGQNRTLLLSTPVELASPYPSLGFWSDNSNLLVELETESWNSKKSFVVEYHFGFCSDFDGNMFLPSYHLQTKPVKVSPIMDSYMTQQDSEIRNSTYRPNANCHWTVPKYDDSTKLTTLVFYRFDLSHGDRITVNTATNAYTFDIFHPPVPIYITDSDFVVNFFSDAKDEGTGFEADILHGSCSSRTIPLRSLTGSISDGSSPRSNYKNGQLCSWMIDPFLPMPDGAYIRVVFDKVSLRNGDILSVHDGDSKFAPALARLHGNQSTPDVVGRHSKVFIFFLSDTSPLPSSQNASLGFSISWQVCTGKCLDCPADTRYNISTLQCVDCPPDTQSGQGSLVCSPIVIEPPPEPQANCTTCGQDYVSPKPQHNEAVMIYMVVGVLVLFIGIGIFVYARYKQYQKEKEWVLL